MATFGIGMSRSIPGRGPSAGFRFTLYAIVSVVCMYLDQRGGWLERARFTLQGAAYPLQLAVNSPAAAWDWVQEVFEDRARLQAENAELKRVKRELELRTMRYEALARENAQLRGLAQALPPVAERWLGAEILSVELNSLRQRLLINRGSRNGVFKAQTVLTDAGLLGQTTRVGPWSAEIILVTDPEHAVPVQIARTGVRTIAVGAGDASALALPYLPQNADIKADDLLVTSGLGGVFPAGYPVARVAEVRRTPGQAFLDVRATPLARLNEDREVALVWFREGHPAAPAVASITGEVASGHAAIQPQPRPTPPPAAVTAATPPSTSPPAAAVASTPAPAARRRVQPDPQAAQSAQRAGTSTPRRAREPVPESAPSAAPAQSNEESSAETRTQGSAAPSAFDAAETPASAPRDVAAPAQESTSESPTEPAPEVSP